ncbi:7-cyano-7-deazaguanine synthase [Burkholderia gladioli]|uniref:7-cyano-7-deazaguanine synthase n=1 Tax=Burkholderia gladioli (strain BSR3) TaxID=999541 RepID=F2LB64_BURGS|nr:7-cyano-7-deazaguanine synthase [Burkholderia gladioli]AEA60133.1 hypothetical protein bgla_1g14630 [Burkholderia gladioli BSR3]
MNKNIHRDDIPSSIFRVVYGPARRSSKSRLVRLGTDILVRPDHLSAYCFRQSDGLAHDLMVLIGAVKYADRKLMRHHSKRWERRLHIELPVFKKNIWLQPDVQASLVHCLNYLTGDEWSFSFTERVGKAPTLSQSPLHEISLANRDLIFVPFSHGLDSYGQVRLLQQTQPEAEVVCIHADARGASGDSDTGLKWKRTDRIRYIRVPVVVKNIGHAEPSFRSRPFMFYLLAGFGALESGSNKVMIPENGQGSLGGSLVTTGHEPKHRSCYPGFTTKLSRFLEALTGKRVQFYHPALFQTKGQVLQALVDAGEDVRDVLRMHRSCSCDARLASLSKQLYHCGVCGNCLLRRTAEHAVRVSDATEYLFDDLTAATLESGMRTGEGEIKLDFFCDLARNGVLDMQRLAECSQDAHVSRVLGMAVDLARLDGASVERVSENVSHLLGQHAAEWKNFLVACGENSWISKVARG